MTEIVAGRRLNARVARLLSATGKDFVTRAVDALDLGFDGIAGDHHAGLTRESGGREPWYPRGTEMKNERQVSIVAEDELDAVATDLGIEQVKPEWIGANMAIEGIATLSMVPPRTLMFFEGGVTLKIDGQNAPCRLAGRSVAEMAGVSDIEAMALRFPIVAKRKRGLVAWVEKPGRIETGEAVRFQIPEQWIYEPSERLI